MTAELALSLRDCIWMAYELIVEISRQVSDESDGNADHILSLQWRERAKDPHRTKGSISIWKQAILRDQHALRIP